MQTNASEGETPDCDRLKRVVADDLRDAPLHPDDPSPDEGEAYAELMEISRLLHLLKELKPEKYREFMNQLRVWTEPTAQVTPEQAVDHLGEADRENGD
jgi:hypothetical protein